SEEAYRRSGRLAEHGRLMAEVHYLDLRYDYDREIELLKTARRLYPYDESAANLLGWLYQFALEDHPAAEAHLRAAYELHASRLNLDIFASSLQIQNKGDAIERLAQDYRTRTGEEPVSALLGAFAARGEWKAILPAID